VLLFIYFIFLDFVIASDGNSLIAVVTGADGQEYIQAWQLLAEGTSNVIFGRKLFESSSCSSLHIPNLITITHLPHYVITISRSDYHGHHHSRHHLLSSNNNNNNDNIPTIPYVIQVWDDTELSTLASSSVSISASNPSSSPLRLLQSITLLLPEHKFRSRSTSLVNPFLETDVRIERHEGRYVVMSSR
jgi:hypothetical protein